MLRRGRGRALTRGAGRRDRAPPNLSTYVRVGRYDLPSAAQEASAVTFDAARDSLFVVGDGATSVVQVSKTGQLIDSMALAGFDDTEGIASLGGGQFVVAEERERRVTRFTYQGGGTLTRTGSVKLGTTIGNTGIEGVAADPTGGLVLVKESAPLGIFRTEVDWAAGTATNGSPTTDNPTNLFDPALAGVTDLADVYATADALLVISQESGRIVNLTRAGAISSALTIGTAGEGHEGITMDGAGRIYVVNETGSPTGTPQLWVYAPSTTPNQALIVSEVAPWSSGDSPFGADWIELTNTGAHAVDITGFRIDDSSNSFASAIALNGVTTIAAGESVIFLEGQPAVANAFKAAWFGSSVPAGLQVGTYSGSGIGLSTDGDAVNLFDAAGTRITGVTFGASTTFFTFDNAAGVSGAITALSVAGVNGAFTTGGMTGSPGAIAAPYEEVKVGGAVSGLVPPQLSIVLGAPAVFAPFAAGVARDYEAFTTATVTSTAGEATLSVSDPSTVAPGHLVNGTLALPQALQVKANGGAYAPVGGTLLTYGGPISGDEVAIGVKQSIGAKDALRTGTYTKALTFTLASSTP